MSDNYREYKVLFIDDNANLLSAIKRQFRKSFQVYTALSGDEGLEVLEQEGPFAVVICDMNMPQMNGATFLKRSSEIVPDTVSAISAQREGFRESVNLAAPESGSPVSGLLEIDLPCGARLRCGSDVSSTHLVRVLTVLRAKP